MANGVQRFQRHGGQFRAIQREVYTDDLQARNGLAIHTAATNARRAPQAPTNHFVGATSLSGVSLGSTRLNAGTSNPISNAKFV